MKQCFDRIKSTLNNHSNYSLTFRYLSSRRIYLMCRKIDQGNHFFFSSLILQVSLANMSNPVSAEAIIELLPSFSPKCQYTVCIFTFFYSMSVRFTRFPLLNAKVGPFNRHKFLSTLQNTAAIPLAS